MARINYKAIVIYLLIAIYFLKVNILCLIYVAILHHIETLLLPHDRIAYGLFGTLLISFVISGGISLSLLDMKSLLSNDKEADIKKHKEKCESNNMSILWIYAVLIPSSFSGCIMNNTGYLGRSIDFVYTMAVISVAAFFHVQFYKEAYMSILSEFTK